MGSLSCFPQTSSQVDRPAPEHKIFIPKKIQCSILARHFSALGITSQVTMAIRLLPVVILAPKGRLGLEIASPNEGTSNYVWVKSVDPSGPLFGRVRPGDVIARINNKTTQFKNIDEVTNMFVETTNSKSRFVTFLRPTPDNSAKEKESAVSQRAPPTSAGSAPKKPPPPAALKAPPPTITPVVPTRPPPKTTPTSISSAMPQMMAPYTPMNNPLLGYNQPSAPRSVAPAAPPAKRKANVVTASKPKKKKKLITKSMAERTWDLLEDIPEPGFVCSKAIFYSTLNNETLAKVAEKLGTDWKTMAALAENTSRYGALRASSVFKTGTLLYIPKNRSKWRMKQLSKVEEIESEECIDCGIESNPAEMLMCDGCDAPHHIACVGLTCVPKGDWFCIKCLDVLKARANNHGGKEALFKLPPLPALSLGPQHQMKETLRTHLQNRRVEAFSNLDSYNVATRASIQSRQQELQAEIGRIEQQLQQSKDEYNRHLRKVMNDHGLNGWSMGNFNKSKNWIEIRENGRIVKLIESEQTIQRATSWWGSATMTNAWNRAIAKRETVYRNAALKKKDKAVKTLKAKLAATKESLAESQRDVKALSSSETEEHFRIEAEYAALLNEPQLKDESNAAYKRREFPPRYIGMVHLDDDTGVLAMNMLSEPDELVIAVPVGDEEDFEPRVGGTYGVFARAALFDKKRDDELPMEKNGVRDAQRRLFQLLSSHDNNKAMIVTRPSIPPTVKLRSDDEIENATRCFDLSELVRDCNVDLDLPKEPTPASMEANGLELRDYQQSSLRWMLDKEKERTGLGLAGELWHRLRFLDPIASEQYFYCELTGSFALDIFDYRADAEQKDASMNRFSMPTGGILGEEMGLGKTVISIALIIQNPPPLEHRVLPREHIWSLEKKTVVDHPAYVPPPKVGSTSRLSNGTLIIVPMTLLSQWQTELEKFAPTLRVMTLHNTENPKLETVASSDVVIASTFLLQKSHKPGTKSGKGNVNLLGLLKRIHFHRLIVDEAHYNQQGEKTKLVLASLSATHRASVTGTPIGAQLSDLQGQLRFLRVAPFDRPAFWKNNIEDPFYDHNLESLRVLRSLLSRVVVRHSKEQTFGDGKALLCLPPRSVETVLLKFGSEAERQVYENIETRNQTYFMKLKRESLKTVASKYLALNGLLTSARQACGHTSLISPEKLHNFNRMSSDNKGVKTQAVEMKKTREGILENALEKARNSAKLRMRVVLNQFQSASELLECPVCLECAGEEEIAIPACAHPLCSHCIISILDGATGTRDASGHCPTCRDIMRRSEITFLGDATDAGTKFKKEDQVMNVDEDSKMPAVASVNGFQITSSNTHVSVTGASTLRAGRKAMTDSQLRQALHSDRAYLSTLKEDFLRSYYDSEAKVGTKISELLQEINAMTRRDPKSKCVVFSQFLGVLDVASEELQARGIGFVRLDGSLKQHERADALLDFSSNQNTRVFLLSMRSGAVGLTLTAADHVFIMDIAQNSAIEEQAIDRCHRIGQTRPVTVKRFVMQDTVEERLLGVRRSLNVDRPSAGTQICGASVLADEEKVAEKAAKMKNRRNSNNDSAEELDDARKQMRVEMLETLFGCSGAIHKA